MCGITGFFSKQNAINAEKYYQSHLLIKHRGPDDEGFIAIDADDEIMPYKGNDTIDYFANLPHIKTINKSRMILGHRRLSILDITQQGHQPFVDKDSRYSMVYNGEVFNYLELRAELQNLGHSFYSQSDTEVVLTAFKEWGTNCFNKFNGMWSLAIYDNLKKQLFLSRDRFGIKPLFFSYVNDVLFFASEMKFIRGICDTKNINNEAIQKYLHSCLLNYSEGTFWEDIKELEPGHWMVFDGTQVKTEKYWTFQPQSIKRSPTDALEEFAYLFEDSLKLRMRSDVEVGTLLSGGMDSTLIVSSLYKSGLIKNDYTFKSFSAVFSEEIFSERKYIEKTLSQVPLKPYFVYPEPEKVKDRINDLLYYIEEPCRSLAVYSQLLIYEKINKETQVKVVLNGQGADELFGGYTDHYFIRFASLLSQFKMKQLVHEVDLFKKGRSVKTKTILTRLFKMFPSALLDDNYFNNMTFRELNFSALREYLKYDDRTSMAFGVEARTPFLDYRLVEFAFSLDESYKIQDYTNKKIERDYASGIAPEEIINRTDKMGFVSPQEIWQRNAMRGQLLAEVPNIKRMINDGVMPYHYEKKYADYFAGKHDNWSLAWRIFCLSRWMSMQHLL